MSDHKKNEKDKEPDTYLYKEDKNRADKPESTAAQQAAQQANPIPQVTVLPEEPRLVDTLPPPPPVAPLESRARARRFHRLGYIKDKSDNRDIPFKLDKATLQALKNLPSHVDLRTTGNFPPVYDQGDLGSCVAQSTAALLYFLDKNIPDDDSFPDVQRSRLQLYYNARKIEGTVDSDDGCMIRDAFKGLNSVGVAPETDWPYEPTRFSMEPPQDVTVNNQKLINYKRISRNLEGIKLAVAAGYPVVVGLLLYSSFESDHTSTTGIVTMPDKKKEQELGGHAVLIVGYDDTKQWFIVRNSWGTTWGDLGYFYLPYEYVKSAKMASDFWSATKF